MKCTCGNELEHASHLACAECMSRVPAGIRDDFMRAAKMRRGAPSYYTARRHLVEALKQIQKGNHGT